MAVNPRIFPFLQRKNSVNDINIIVTFLQKYSLELVIIGLITVIVTNIVKTLLPERLKNFKGYLPFLLGIIFYAIFSLLFLKNIDFYLILSKGIQAGGLATLFYAFFKHFISSKGDIKTTFSEILKGIISSKSISDVAVLLSNLFHSQVGEEELIEKIEVILKENTDVSGEVLEAVTKLIKNTITDKK